VLIDAEIGLLRRVVDMATHRLNRIDIGPNLEWAREYWQPCRGAGDLPAAFRKRCRLQAD
jgi:hypothetical protein